MATNKREDTNLITKFLASINQEIADADAVLFRKVSAAGNSGHITIPKEYIGKYARVIITSGNGEDKIEIKKINAQPGSLPAKSEILADNPPSENDE